MLIFAHAKHYHFPFFSFDFKYSALLLPFLFPVNSTPKVFWPTHNRPEKWVTTLRMLTPKYLTVFTLGVFTCVNLSSFPRLPLTYTLSRSPCCAHRWYWHMAATFAVFANLALLLQCLFLLPSGLHSALCKCHSSPVVSLGCRKFRVRSVMLSVKYHSNSTQQ